MKTELTVALIAGAVALASAGGTIWSSLRTDANARAIEQLKAAAERQKEVSKFSEPLAEAAYDLQSRLRNILQDHFIEVHLVRGNEREKSYAINNTVYLVAQYLCWTEEARRQIRFIDLGDNAKTRELLRLQDTISGLWGTDKQSRVFRIFAGEQRAIGEALIQTDPPGSECIGYGTFLKNFAPRVNPLIDALRTDVESLGTGIARATDRLKNIQNALIDLLMMLDPDSIRFPSSDRRSKVMIAS